LEGGIIEYARQVKEEGIESKFIGKNFVFDHRLGERITDDIIAQCHQCGTPCDNHTNCANEACHLLFIQCDDCKAAMENCCSAECHDIIQLSFEEQKKLRKGLQVGNKIFRKGKSEKLKFKQGCDSGIVSLAKADKNEDIRQKIDPKRKIRKALLGKATHFYTKAQVGLFQMENDTLAVGDKIIISGPTTGNQELTIEKMFVNGAENTTAKTGDKVTLGLPFRVRLSDKLYKILN
jgi:UPF0176 protein